MGKSMNLSAECVYTIALPTKLFEAAKHGTPIQEVRPWQTAKRLLTKANHAGQQMPVVFADSRACKTLICWSILKSIKVTDKGTAYTIGPLWCLPKSTQQQLRVLSSGKYIAPGYIKPYIPCETPRFLFKESADPRSYLQSSEHRFEVQEGERRLALHRKLELQRNRTIIKDFKRECMRRNDGRLPCEVCGFDFYESYGPIGADFAEAHHKTSLSKATPEGRITNFADLSIVCANCHRMLHRGPEFPTIDTLRKRYKAAMRKLKKHDMQL